MAGDCVLWAGAGFGDLAGRPGWSDLLTTLVDRLEPAVQPPLRELIEQGRLRTVLSYIHRHHGDDPLANLLKEVAQQGQAPAAGAASEGLGRLPWRAFLATTHADVIWQILHDAGQSLDVISHTDVHDLSLRRHPSPFVLRTPPTGRSMRADRVFFELVEEIVKTRTILFLGFDPDDPDLFQIFELLDRIGRGRRHFAWLPYVSEAEAEELLEQRGIAVIHAEADTSIPDALQHLLRATSETAPHPSAAEGELARLDLERALARIDERADLATDVALSFDPHELDALIAGLPGHDIKGLDPRSLLRVGSVQLAHGRIDRARRAFQLVVSRGAGREYEAIARYNLALVTASEGDGAGAVEGLTGAYESSRTLAVVPPRFEITGCHGRDVARLWLTVRDRETREDFELQVMTLGHHASPAEQRRFYEEVERLVEIDHPALQSTRGAVADGRHYGILTLPRPGVSLGALLSEDGGDGPMGLERAFELLGPLMEALVECHRRQVLHRNIRPDAVVLTREGPMLRGFGAPPVLAFSRPSVRLVNRGYVAPEVLAGALPTPESDVYSLCAVLYRCLAGRAPEGGVPSPLEAHPELDPRVGELLDRALHPDPARRPELTKLRLELARILTTPMAVGTLSSSEQAEAELSSLRQRVETLTQEREAQQERLEELEAELVVAREMAAEAGVDIDGAAAGLRAALAEAEAELARLRTELASGETTADETGAPAAPAATREASSAPLSEPSDPDDLEGWTWVLERKPNHLEARQNIERIEARAREEGRWDRVADVLMVRAQISQVQRDRVALLRELAGLFEAELGAPASALETLEALLEDLTGPARVELCDDLFRLGEVTGDHAKVASLALSVATGAAQPEDRARLRARVGRIYDLELGALEPAIAAYTSALEDDPEDLELLRALAALLRRAGRPAELAATLLTLGERSEGAARHEALIEAARELHGELGDDEGALAALELVLDEAPGQLEALELAEGLAESLERWAVLASVLEGLAELDDDRASAGARLRRAAELRRGSLDDARGAFEALLRAMAMEPEDLEAARALVELCREKGASSAEARAAMIDALGVMAGAEADDTRRAALLEEQASRLDAEADGGERAADARAQLLKLVPLESELAQSSVDRLVTFWSEAQTPATDAELAALLGRLAGSAAMPAARRVDALVRLVELSEGRLADPALTRRSLEQLVALDPGATRWRERLVEHLIEAGDSARAGALIDEQLSAIDDPGVRVGLVLSQARLLAAAGDEAAAEARLLEASEQAPDEARVWAALRDHYNALSRPLKALDAAIRAAELEPIPTERARALFDAVEALEAATSDEERALTLLEAAVEADPDHRAATEKLLEKLVRAGALERAWPHARAHVSQVKARLPDDAAANLRALSLAGRCALAAGEGERAREYLARARDLDARDLEVRRLLADLDLDAGAYEDAIKGYQACALGAGDELDGPAQAELYVRMGEAWQGQGQGAKAQQMFERAAEVDPEGEAALRKLIELAGSDQQPAAQVAAIDRLADRLTRKAARSSGTSADTASDEAYELLREAAVLLAEKLDDAAGAAARLQRVLEARPSDPSILHQALDLYTNARQWTRATEVLGRLADLQSDVGPRVAYLYAAAVLIRDNMGDKVASAEWMRRVLAADPMHEKAFKAVVQLLEEVGAYKELSRVLRDRLKALPEDADLGVRERLLSTLGQLYEQQLDDPDTALAAYEQAALVVADDERRLELQTRMLELARSAGAGQRERAIALTQQIVAARPTDFDRYHDLVDLFEEAGHRDGAVCAARALAFVKQANNKELAIANRGAKGFVQARGTLPRELWKSILHPHARQQARLTELFALIWPVLAARIGQTYSMLGIDRGDRTQVSLQTPGVVSYLAFACQVFDVPVPELYLRKGQAGGFMSAAPSDGQGIYPSLIAGDDAIGQQAEAAHAFRAARAAFRAQPQFLIAELYRGSGGLKDGVWAGIAAAHPAAPVPGELRERVAPVAEDIRRLLPPAHASRLEAVTRRIVEAGSFDVRAWAEGVDFTGSRVGYLLAGSLESSVRVLSQGSAEGSAVPAKEVLKDLVAFSVSPGYLQARKALKLSV